MVSLWYPYGKELLLILIPIQFLIKSNRREGTSLKEEPKEVAVFFILLPKFKLNIYYNPLFLLLILIPSLLIFIPRVRGRIRIKKYALA